MLRRIAIGLVLAVLVALPATAQDFEKGWNAFLNGDYGTALAEWRPLAIKGDAKAQVFLAIIYNTGAGVTQDYTEGAKWLRKAAVQNDVRAQFGLGEAHYKGNGVAQNIVLAHMWLSLAAAKGHARAIKRRDGVAKLMTSAQIAEAQKLAREWLAKHKKK